jgi:hypothetical protein
MLMLGFADTGVLEAARASVDKKMLTKIQTDLVTVNKTEPLYFTLIVKSEGISQAIFNADISYFEQKIFNINKTIINDTTTTH